MAQCTQCGNQLNEGEAVCPSCGAQAGGQPQYAPQQPVYQSAGDDVQNNKVMAVLAYLGILVLVPILAAKQSPFARFHANQGLVLCLTSIALSIVINIITLIVPILGLILSLLGFVILALMIIGIVNACKGETKPLPIIGSITLLK